MAVRPAATARRDLGRRAAVLRLVKESAAPVGVKDLAARLGVHPNTVRFHLDALVAEGRVERVAGPSRSARPDDAGAGPRPRRGAGQSRGTGRPPVRYVAVPGMDRDGPRRYELLADALVRGLAAGPEAVRRAVDAGRAWGEAHAHAVPTAVVERDAPVDRLVAMLDDIGFEPEPVVDTAGAPVAVDMHRCPFLELAEEHAEVVCAVHLGIVQGALDAWGDPVTVDRLSPFVEPDRCTAHLVARAPGRPGR